VGFDIELGVYEMLYLLFLPGFAVFEQVKQPFSLLVVELRGSTASEARGLVSESAVSGSACWRETDSFAYAPQRFTKPSP